MAEVDPTALIAEDDRDFRETLRYWLSDAGWSVASAGDGVEALAALDGRIDVLLLDRRMPERTGSAVLDRLDETGFDGPVVVLSARRPDQYLGRDDVARYLVKPVDREEVLEALDSVVLDPVA